MMSDIMQVLEQKFKSGNDIPVTRAAITREEYEQIMAVIKKMEACVDKMTAQIDELTEPFYRSISPWPTHTEKQP